MQIHLSVYFKSSIAVINNSTAGRYWAKTYTRTTSRHISHWRREVPVLRSTMNWTDLLITTFMFLNVAFDKGKILSNLI